MVLLESMDYIFTTMLLPACVYVVSVFLVFAKPFSDKVLDVLSTIFAGGKTELPPLKNELLLLSATELAEKIRKRQVSALSVMHAYIDRIKEVTPQVNAVVDHRFEEALADAKEVDKMLASNLKSEDELESRLPLLGVPFSCKEIVGIKGLAQTNGMMAYKDRKAPEDAFVASQCRKAGAIPVAVTNIPTMLLWWDTSNPVFGRTTNPYDRRRAAGGSSGGEGALISSAGSVIGIGSDLGGSIRLPSAFCGIYGHKPSQGLVSNKTAWEFALDAVDAYMVLGPMCRYVEDLKLLMKAIVTDDKKRLLSQKVDFRKVKVYYMETFPGVLLAATADVRAAVRKAVRQFEGEYQVTAKELRIEELEYSLLIWQCIMLDAAGPIMRQALADESGNLNILWEYVKCVLGCSQYDFRLLYYTASEIYKKDDDFHKHLKMFDTMKEKFEDIFAADSILILPTHPEPPPHPITTIPKFKNITYTAVFNILGYPVTQVPAGFSRGLPVGVQVVSGKNKDYLTLAAASELDQVFGGWKCPGPVKI